LLTIGSLFSGACDSLAEGFASRGHPLLRVYATEIDSLKQQVLRSYYAYIHVFGDAALVKLFPRVDVLVATPSCHEVSSVRHPDDDFDVGSAVDSHLQAITRAVQESRPEVFVVEQSSGLYTHHRSVFDRFDTGSAPSHMT
jgi:site-specific DNA-cytosine methylase